MMDPINNRHHPKPPIWHTNVDNPAEIAALAIVVLGPIIYFFGFWIGWWG